MTTTALIPVLQENSLSLYLREIAKFPMLDPDREYMLARRYHDYQDLDAAHELTTSHLRLAAKVALTFRHYGLPLADLISEANIGLMQAIKKFDPEKGFRLSTYAIWWIKAAISDFILKSWSLVKIGTTAAQKKLFFNLRKIKNKLNLNDDRELSPAVLNRIAGSLDVSVQEVTDMNTRLKAHDGSLNSIIDASGDGGSEWMDFIADSKPNQEEVLAYGETIKYRRTLFNKALNVLNKREKDILFKRRLLDKAFTLDDLSKAYGISKERVRQIELNSIKKIRKAIEAGI